MSGFDFRKFVAAAFGALVFTTVSVGAAVGPARALETAPVAATPSPAQANA